LQQNSLPTSYVVIVTSVICIGDGNGSIGGFCRESIIVCGPDHNDFSVADGFSNPCLTQKDSALSEIFWLYFVFRVYPVDRCL
jgi:hypothetical protein